MPRQLPKAPTPLGRTWVALALVAAAYLYPFPYHPQVNNPNENVRFFMTAALVDEGTYAIDAVRARWGWVNDAGVHGGHVYSVKAPGTSLLGVPAYWLYRRVSEWRQVAFDRTTALWAVRMGGSALPMLVFLFFYHRWLRRRAGPPVVRDAVVLSLGVGSLLYAYALLFVSHTTSAATSFGAFMLLESARRTRHVSAWAAFAAGFLAASTTALEYPGFVATALLCTYAVACLRPWHRLVPFGVGAALPTAAVLQFHQSAFGNPFTPGHRYLEHEAFRDLANQGFFGASEFSLDAAGGLLFHPSFGLFPLTPILALAALGFPALLAARKTRLDAAVALAIPAGTYLLICFMNNWRGGWTVGPRYLALTLPFLGWAAVEGGRVLHRRMPRTTDAFAIGTTAAGIVASGTMSVYYPHVPEAFTRPLPQLIRPLIRHDFAPLNAGTWLAAALDWAPFVGSASMMPLAVLALLALGWMATAMRRWTDRVLVLALASFFSSMCLAPLVAEDASATGAADALAYVVRFWEPAGNDAAARLEARARRAPLSPAEWDRLVHIYLEEGRATEAQATERRARVQRAADTTPRVVE